MKSENNGKKFEGQIISLFVINAFSQNFDGQYAIQEKGDFFIGKYNESIEIKSSQKSVQKSDLLDALVQLYETWVEHGRKYKTVVWVNKANSRINDKVSFNDYVSPSVAKAFSLLLSREWYKNNVKNGGTFIRTVNLTDFKKMVEETTLINFNLDQLVSESAITEILEQNKFVFQKLGIDLSVMRSTFITLSNWLESSSKKIKNEFSDKLIYRVSLQKGSKSKIFKKFDSSLIEDVSKELFIKKTKIISAFFAHSDPYFDSLYVSDFPNISDLRNEIIKTNDQKMIYAYLVRRQLGE